MIFTNHAHVFPKEIREDGCVDRLMELLDECGIDKCIAFAPFQSRLDEEGFGQNANRWLAEEIKNNSRLMGFGTVDMDASDVRSQVRMIADLGFKGIKLHPPYQEFRVDGERAFEVYDEAQSLGLFLSFHTGMHWHRLRESTLLMYDEIAWNFKDLKFSMEHVGGFSFFREALAVMVNNMRGGLQPRVYAGWTSIAAPDEEGVYDAWTLTDSDLKTIIYQTGETRSIFGLDFPYKDAEYIKKSIERIRGLDISDEAKERILGRNLAEALGTEF